VRTIYLLSLIILFLTTTVEPQWSNQNLVPDGNHIWSSFFVDDNTGWIVGSDGFIKKTTNSGLDWIQQNSSTLVTLRSVHFFNQSTGWICGENGLILKTIDGGQNWITLSSGTAETLTDLYFTDFNIGYAVGFNETIMKTTDGGMNWFTQSSGTSFDLYSVDFVSPLVGFAVGGRDSSYFLKTTDAGFTWIRKTPLLGFVYTPILNCVNFIDASTGWIGSEGQYLNHSGNISKTTDGGESWSSTVLLSPFDKFNETSHTTEDNPLDEQKGIRSIYFRDSENGYAVGGTCDGWWRNIFITTDGGSTWQNKYDYPEQTGLLSVFVNNNGKGWAFGYYGVIYITEDYGVSWSQILSGINLQYGYTGDNIKTICMINDNIGYAGGSRKGIQNYPVIFKTTNGGKIWKTILEEQNYWYNFVTDIYFIDENTGWASIFDNGLLIKTTDGGASWNETGNFFADEIFFTDQNIGWKASISPAGIWKSTDGGITWIQKSSAFCSGVYFSDVNHGWAVGTGGNILVSTNGGETWISKSGGTTTNLNSVHFYDINNGICVGNSGTVLLTTDGGENWNLQNLNIVNKLNSASFSGEANIWIAGAGGTIISSNDLGNNWTFFNGITSNTLNSISFISENDGWFAGRNGTILKYQNDVTPVELLSFTANFDNGNVTLSWQTATETNNLGFEIERSSDGKSYSYIGFVKGRGNSTSTTSYLYVDQNPDGSDHFQYRIKQIDLDGTYEYSNVIEVKIVPNNFTLYQNYPNPFNPTTKIKYTIPSVAAKNNLPVILKVYDILGNEVATLVDEAKQPGIYEVEFAKSDLVSGVYFYQMQVADFSQTKKMVLLR
jgi:photosystem II stability/assembly factor-like uncharacterized protein